MFSPKDIDDQASTVKKWLKRVFSKGRVSPVKRILTLIVFGFVFVLSYQMLLKSLLSEAKENDEKLLQDRNWVVEANLYDSAARFARLCISSTKSDSPNALWYCEKAKILYKNNSTQTPPNLREEIIKRDAYGAMVVDMESQIAGIKLDKLNQVPPASNRLDLLLSKTGIYLTSSLAIFGILAFIFGSIFTARMMARMKLDILHRRMVLLVSENC